MFKHILKVFGGTLLILLGVIFFLCISEGSIVTKLVTIALGGSLVLLGIDIIVESIKTQVNPVRECLVTVSFLYRNSKDKTFHMATKRTKISAPNSHWENSALLAEEMRKFLLQEFAEDEDAEIVLLNYWKSN